MDEALQRALPKVACCHTHAFVFAHEEPIVMQQKAHDLQEYFPPLAEHGVPMVAAQPVTVPLGSVS